MIIIIILIIKFICRRDVLLSVFPVGKTGFTGLADNNASLFLLRSEKMLFRIFFLTSGAQRHQNTRCAPPSAAFYAICCVSPLPRDPARGSVKRCFAHSLTVVHFRKLRYSVKIGSHRNGHPVI